MLRLINIAERIGQDVTERESCTVDIDAAGHLVIRRTHLCRCTIRHRQHGARIHRRIAENEVTARNGSRTV